MTNHFRQSKKHQVPFDDAKIYVLPLKKLTCCIQTFRMYSFCFQKEKIMRLEQVILF